MTCEICEMFMNKTDKKLQERKWLLKNWSNKISSKKVIMGQIEILEDLINDFEQIYLD